MAQLDSMPVEREYSCREVVKLEYDVMKIQLIKGILENVFQQTSVWRSWKLVEKARKGRQELAGRKAGLQLHDRHSSTKNIHH